MRLTSLSRCLLASSLRFQNGRLFRGRFACFGELCQKHPSTKTASLSLGKTKSGLPNTGAWRRQPVMPWRRNSRIKAYSVSLFPRPRMRAIFPAARIVGPSGARPRGPCGARPRGKSVFAPGQGSPGLGEAGRRPALRIKFGVLFRVRYPRGIIPI